jgi:hypothetical protein
LAFVVLFVGGGVVLVISAVKGRALKMWGQVFLASIVFLCGALVLPQIPSATFSDPSCQEFCSPTQQAVMTMIGLAVLLFVGGTCLIVIAAVIARVVRLILQFPANHQAEAMQPALATPRPADRFAQSIEAMNDLPEAQPADAEGSPEISPPDRPAEAPGAVYDGWLGEWAPSAVSMSPQTAGMAGSAAAQAGPVLSGADGGA